MKVLVIAGHGENDPGAIGVNGLREVDLTREIARALAEYPEMVLFDTSKNAFQHQSILSSYTGKIDYAVEIHLNAYEIRSVNGVEIYQTPFSTHTYDPSPILTYLHSMGYKNRGLKSANFSVISTLEKNHVPAILVECGFITNEKDMDIYNPKKIADAIYKGLTEMNVVENQTNTPIVNNRVDDTPSDWAKSWCEKANEMGIMTGKRYREFMTREEAAAMGVKIIEYIKSEANHK